MKTFKQLLNEVKSFDVILNGKVIDTVFYADNDNITPDEVKRSLVDHDGYDSNIKIRPGKANKWSNAPKVGSNA